MREYRDNFQVRNTQQKKVRQAVSPDATPSPRGRTQQILQLQRTLGNRAAGQFLQAKRLTSQGGLVGVQPKLMVGVAGDQYEQEADRVARHVLSMPDAVAANSMQRAMSPEEDKEQQIQTKPLAASITPFVQRQGPEDEKDKPVQPKSAGSLADSFEAGADIETQISQGKGRGSPLPDPVRAYMEPRFGADFSQVRVHTGSDAIRMNRDVGAQAFTHGSDIYFGAGHSPTNLDLTAHELTHVVQQTGAISRKLIQRTIDPTYPVTHGNFNVNATPGGSNLPITIRFEPFVTAPYSNQIGLIQVVRLTDTTGANIEPQSLPAARGASLRTTADAATGVEGGYFTDVLHNDAPAHGGTGTDAPAGSALPPQYPFGNDPAQPNPTTPGLSRPFSGGASGATIGYKRSNDPADIKAAELTDAPGYPSVNPANADINFDFETAAKGEDTMTVYGALKWGFEIRSGVVQNEHASVQDAQSATFDAALERHQDFYVHEPVIFYFDFDSATLSSGEADKIDTFVDYLRRFPDVRVNPEGFADRRGGASQHNLDLSLRRALAVDAALRAKGVLDSQISPITVGSGATEDFTQDATTDQDREGNRQANRRVVLTFEHVPAAGGAGGTP